jgi:hypothetical protein
MRRWALSAVGTEPSNERFFLLHGGVWRDEISLFPS